MQAETGSPTTSQPKLTFESAAPCQLFLGISIFSVCWEVGYCVDYRPNIKIEIIGNMSGKKQAPKSSGETTVKETLFKAMKAASDWSDKVCFADLFMCISLWLRGSAVGTVENLRITLRLALHTYQVSRIGRETHAFGVHLTLSRQRF
jgi:hypothetical protein